MMNAKQMPGCHHRVGPLGLPIYSIGLILLMLVSPFALAKPDCPRPNHPSCNDGGGGGSPIPYSAVIIEHDVSISTVPAPDPPDYPYPLYEPGYSCEGRAYATTNMTVLLPIGTCADFDTSYHEDLLTQTRALNVLRDKKSGTIISSWFFGQGVIGGEVRAHISDEIVDAPFFIENLGEGIFIVHLHARGVDLFQCDAARMKGKTVCNTDAGKFAIDDVIYFPTP